jgi:chromate transporter
MTKNSGLGWCFGIFHRLLSLVFVRGEAHAPSSIETVTPHKISFALIGLFAFGGGFASLPLMFHEVVDVHGWLGSPTFLNGIALGQVTPGPIVATFGIFVPSFLIVVGLAPYFDEIRDSPRFHRIFSGILFSFVGLLVSVTIRLAMSIPWDIPSIILLIGTFTALVLGVEILWVVLAGTVISYLLF